MREKNRDAQLQINAFVRIPERDAFPPQSPEKAAENDVFGIHVHKDGVVVVTQSPGEREESPGVCGAGYRAVLFPERMHAHVRGELVLPFCETDYFNALGMFREFLDPTAKEPQNVILLVHCLRNYQ